VSANFTANPSTQYGIYDQISRPNESSQTRFINLDAEWRVSDALSFKGKLGDTKGDGRTPTQDVGEFNAGIGSGASYQLFGTNTAAHWALGNESPSVPGTLSWIFGDQNIDVLDEEKYAQLDGVYQIGNGSLTDLRFGARYSDHTRKSEGVIGQGPGPGAFDNLPSGFSLYPSDFGSDLGSGFPKAVWFYTAAQLAAFNSKYTNRDPISRADWTGDYSLKEKDPSAYIQADFDGQGWGGNIGVRFVRTEEDVVSNVGTSASTPGAITTSAFGPYLPTRFNNSYDDVLPSANVKFDLQEDLLLRLAAATTITRPDYSALAAPISLTFQPSAPNDGTTGSGNGSNPNLKPVKSNNSDIAGILLRAEGIAVSERVLHGSDQLHRFWPCHADLQDVQPAIPAGIRRAIRADRANQQFRLGQGRRTGIRAAVLRQLRRRVELYLCRRQGDRRRTVGRYLEEYVQRERVLRG
jgi:iron complex outermembrane receptor protein